MCSVARLSRASGRRLPIPDPSTLRRVATVLAWAALMAIAFATLSPIELRPRLGPFVQVERFGAFMVLGGLFSVAYRRPLLVLGFVLALAVGLETFQYLSPTRHARVLDLAVKAGGAAFGVYMGWLFLRALPPRVGSPKPEDHSH